MQFGIMTIYTIRNLERLPEIISTYALESDIFFLSKCKLEDEYRKNL